LQILYSHDANSQTSEIPRSVIVVDYRKLIIVTVAIDLDDELQSVAVKVSDVWPDRVLTPELPIAEASIAQPTPDNRFCERRLFAKASR
jgi:hypothetical protein